jgi:tetraacyldisaccharide 4'-kinase
MRDTRVIDRLWWGDGPAARAGRLALLPLELLYGGAVAARGALYDAGVLRSYSPAIPAVSVGNITTGGTGKTPVAAWLAGTLAELGAHPAIVLRGYGADEPLVHARLNPGVPVVVSADRLAGIARAAAGGADVAVLDDAFQHRRARRAVDIVLVSAERWSRRPRLLPAGPWREPARALRRASLLLVTRKAASAEEAVSTAADLARAAPGIACGVVRLALSELRAAGGDQVRPLNALAGARVRAISGIGDPGSFLRQLAEHGAHVHAHTLPDHHPYSAVSAERLAAAMEPGEMAVCTLKDAVKLAPVWPRAAPPLWYVSQRLMVEHGAEAIGSLLATVLAARRPHS